jgi:hypothetical protein
MNKIFARIKKDLQKYYQKKEDNAVVDFLTQEKLNLTFKISY